MYNYRELYEELGNLFYAVAAWDGSVTAHEKETVLHLVQFNWRHLENSTDEFGSEGANIIEYQFEYNTDQGKSCSEAYESFREFYQMNSPAFSPSLKERILSSVRHIAESTRGINDRELQLLMQLREMLLWNAPAS